MTKANEYYASVADDRNKWKREQTRDGFLSTCWVCGSRHDLIIHEMAKRSQAPNKWGERCNYFLACNTCNCDVLEDPTLTHQLAIKALRDPRHYDRQRVNVLRGRAPDAIDYDDVLEAMTEIAFCALSKVLAGGANVDLTPVLKREGLYGNADGFNPIFPRSL